MAYEIWDGDSGNLLIARPTKNEALAVVREAIATHGEHYIDSLALILEDDEGESHLLAEGPELASLAAASMFRAQIPRIQDTRAVKPGAKVQPKEPMKFTGAYQPGTSGQNAPASGQYRQSKSNPSVFVKHGKSSSVPPTSKSSNTSRPKTGSKSER